MGVAAQIEIQRFIRLIENPGSVRLASYRRNFNVDGVLKLLLAVRPTPGDCCVQLPIFEGTPCNLVVNVSHTPTPLAVAVRIRQALPRYPGNFLDIEFQGRLSRK